MTTLIKAILIRRDTKQIHQVVYGPNVETYPENGTYGDYDIIYDRSGQDFWKGTQMDLWYWDETDTAFKYAEPRPMQTFNWETKTYEDIQYDLAAAVAHRRAGKLYESDWTQLPDSPLTTEKKAEWATYRQALRDITTQLEGVDTMQNVPWPTKPT